MHSSSPCVQSSLAAIQKGEVVGSGAVHAPFREPGGNHEASGGLKPIQEERKGGGCTGVGDLWKIEV